MVPATLVPEFVLQASVVAECGGGLESRLPPLRRVNPQTRAPEQGF
jgi:hypothetical protein